MAKRGSTFVEELDFDTVITQAVFAEFFDFITRDDFLDLELRGEVDKSFDCTSISIVFPRFIEHPSSSFFDDGGVGAVVVEDVNAANLLRLEVIELIAYFCRRGAEEEVKVSACLLNDGKGAHADREKAEEEGGDKAHAKVKSRCLSSAGIPDEDRDEENTCRDKDDDDVLE